MHSCDARARILVPKLHLGMPFPTKLHFVPAWDTGERSFPEGFVQREADCPAYEACEVQLRRRARSQVQLGNEGREAGASKISAFPGRRLGTRANEGEIARAPSCVPFGPFGPFGPFRPFAGANPPLFSQRALRSYRFDAIADDADVSSRKLRQRDRGRVAMAIRASWLTTNASSHGNALSMNP